MDLSNVESQLEEVGLTKSETKVYLALLKLGASTTGPIIDKSQTANSKIYIVLEKLIHKGLITFFKQEGLRYYKAAHPRQISRYLKEKQEKIGQQGKKVKEIFPSLELLFAQQEEDREAVVYRGGKAIRTAFSELVGTLKKGDHVNIMGVYNFGEEFKRHAFYFQKIRSKKGIKANFLMNKGFKIAEEFMSYPPLEIRFMKEGIITPAIFLIYKNKVIISLADDLVFFVLTSQRAADAFNVYFKQLWKGAKKYKSKT